jgi:hypothetical protein
MRPLTTTVESAVADPKPEDKRVGEGFSGLVANSAVEESQSRAEGRIFALFALSSREIKRFQIRPWFLP